jgi:hypothetical protein
MPDVETCLEHYCGPLPQKKDMLQIARELCGICRINMDRLAKRSQACLWCWFCENWNTIRPRLGELRKQLPGAYDTRIPPIPDEPSIHDEFVYDDFPDISEIITDQYYDDQTGWK